jgi:metal-sulfur cluster biosynthetic enzyme
MINEEEVLEVLKTVYDPEIFQSIVALNMVKSIDISPELVHIDLVLTTPMCPMAPFMIEEIQLKLEQIIGDQKVEVVILDELWIPPWKKKDSEKND